MEKRLHPGKISMHNCPPFPKDKDMKLKPLGFKIESQEYKGNPVFNHNPIVTGKGGQLCINIFPG